MQLIHIIISSFIDWKIIELHKLYINYWWLLDRDSFSCYFEQGFLKKYFISYFQACKQFKEKKLSLCCCLMKNQIPFMLGWFITMFNNWKWNTSRNIFVEFSSGWKWHNFLSVNMHFQRLKLKISSSCFVFLYN